MEPSRHGRLASIWTGTNEIMLVIAASDWYAECAEQRKQARTRDVEGDAPEAGAEEEKDYG